MTKTQLNVSVDADIYKVAKDKKCPFSAVVKDALQDWIAKNLSQEEREKLQINLEEKAKNLKYSLEASKVNTAVFRSSYLMRIFVEAYKNNGFSDEEIDKILQLAKEENNI